jgi:all-trans-retinol 13,14-reductase
MRRHSDPAPNARWMVVQRLEFELGWTAESPAPPLTSPLLHDWWNQTFACKVISFLPPRRLEWVVSDGRAVGRRHDPDGRVLRRHTGRQDRSITQPFLFHDVDQCERQVNHAAFQRKWECIMAQKFDAIVIGSGLGGLTAGALCAKAGLRVLVLERNDTFGGAATVYRHNGLAIEASLHEIDGFDEDDPKLPLIRVLGLDRDLQFVDVGDLYEVRGGPLGEPFVLPHGADAALAAAIARFPQHTTGLKEYFRRLLALRGAASLAAHHREDGSWWLLHAPEALRKLWPLLSQGRATLGEVLRQLFGGDEAVKLALAANLAYYHDDPDRMSFLRFAVAQASFVIGGGHYLRGGSQALSNRLVALIREAGGELEAGREVDALLIEGGRVTGVHHIARDGKDPRTDLASIVFGNAAPRVLAAMLPAQHREAFLAPYDQRNSSIALWTVSLGLSRPAKELGVGRYSTFVLPSWLTALAQMREAASVMGEEPGGRLPPYVFVDHSHIDTGLNQNGPHFASYCGVDRLENWSSLTSKAMKERKEKWIDSLVADIDRHFPGIASTVVHREMATAETMQRYLNTPGGAVYGFAPEGTLGQTLKQGPRTSIGGLWLASAYTSGGGFTGAMLGGAQAASAAIREARHALHS